MNGKTSDLSTSVYITHVVYDGRRCNIDRPFSGYDSYITEH